jgi:predicted phosphodiesterase
MLAYSGEVNLTTYRELVEKYGGMKPAARATGLSFGKIQRGIRKEENQLDKFVRQECFYETPPYIKPNLVKTLVISDTHDDPRIAKDRWRWMGYHAKKYQYDHIIHLGDVLDLLSLCDHVRNDSHGGRFKGTYQDDLASLNESLGLFQSESGNIPVYGVLGNHDIRAKTYENRFPETNGTLHHMLMQVFKSNNWHMKEYGERLTVEGVDYIHTPFAKGSGTKPLGGQNIMARQAKRIVRPMAFGHNHMRGVYTEDKDDGEHGNVWMINVPCSLPQGYVFDYVGDSPSGWSYGVLSITTMGEKILSDKMYSMIELQKDWEER